MFTGIKIDRREFNRALQSYVKHSRRDLATVVNTKAYYIARRASVETPKADKAKILADLRSERLRQIRLKSGKVKNVRTTLAGLIVMARTGKTKKKDIKDDVKKFISARVRSISFLKSGWIPAIKKLEPLADRISGAARIDKSAQQIGKAKGYAIPATEGDRPKAQITNDALPKVRGGLFKSLFGGNKSQALKYAVPGLQKAFDFEAKSMLAYVEKKLAAAAKRAGIRAS